MFSPSLLVLDSSSPSPESLILSVFPSSSSPLLPVLFSLESSTPSVISSSSREIFSPFMPINVLELSVFCSEAPSRKCRASDGSGIFIIVFYISHFHKNHHLHLSHSRCLKRCCCKFHYYAIQKRLFHYLRC
jgi:hypothetical protein